MLHIFCVSGMIVLFDKQLLSIHSFIFVLLSGFGETQSLLLLPLSKVLQWSMACSLLHCHFRSCFPFCFHTCNFVLVSQQLISSSSPCVPAQNVHFKTYLSCLDRVSYLHILRIWTSHPGFISSSLHCALFKCM